MLFRIFGTISITFALAFLFLAPQPALAEAATNKCAGDPIDVGAFMRGICEECYKEGDCALRDIEMVFVNIADFVLSIVAGLVLLMYVAGGTFMLVSGMYPAGREKGIKMIQTSTVGLLIVFFAYTGVHTLKSALVSGTIGGSEQTICYSRGESDNNDGAPCDVASTCWGGRCATNCSQKKIDPVAVYNLTPIEGSPYAISPDLGGVIDITQSYYRTCLDPFSAAAAQEAGVACDAGSGGLCPDDQYCCDPDFIYHIPESEEKTLEDLTTEL